MRWAANAAYRTEMVMVASTVPSIMFVINIGLTDLFAVKYEFFNTVFLVKIALPDIMGCKHVERYSRSIANVRARALKQRLATNILWTMIILEAKSAMFVFIPCISNLSKKYRVDRCCSHTLYTTVGLQQFVTAVQTHTEQQNTLLS